MAGKVWFVTGSSQGLGRAIVQAALHAGDRVVATARRPGQLADLAVARTTRWITSIVDQASPASRR
jgi:NAD(P)-dependent dehydrogenase (short-subunit alcohol dehydrogenase family)